ncbi:hypothetical protein C8R46DRAFT_907603 [Mycena filopes]|nr:hypothetical protein C8R46DRAFT_907603 [Mycena filopes]
MAGQYYPYATNQAWYSAEYNYYPSAGYSDGFQSRDYSSYGYNNGSAYNNYPDYRNPQANYPQYPQYFPLQQPAPPRQRTPTPPPPPAEPSAEYIAASLAPQPKSITPGQRKLLIFDLNGTLLLRSPRKYGQQRKIYLRPYAGALVAFIAHPAVRAWLDCMVWSSAQVYNVREMVERVFGEGEGTGMGYILRAVWARDTLGLGREAFPPQPPTEPTLSIDLDLAPDSDPPPYPHGPHTTLLVDDSPLKARLQPWNHLCVSEYDAPTRARDRAFACLPPDADPNVANVANGVDESPAAEKSGEPSKKRKREAETDGDSEEAKQNDTTIIEAPPMPADGEPYDPTLLAVIGVLSHVRSVGNVAAWVRSGGLAAIVEGEPEEAAKDALVPTTSDSDANAGADPAATLTADPSQWFTSRRLLVAWAVRGRAALAELGITANPGVQ